MEQKLACVLCLVRKPSPTSKMLWRRFHNFDTHQVLWENFKIKKKLKSSIFMPCNTFDRGHYPELGPHAFIPLIPTAPSGITRYMNNDNEGNK